jgi:hypothetical protein
MSKLKFMRDFNPHPLGTMFSVVCMDGELEVARLERVLSADHMQCFMGNPFEELDAMERELRDSDAVKGVWL